MTTSYINNFKKSSTQSHRYILDRASRLFTTTQSERQSASKGQRNSIFEYHKVALNSFNDMEHDIKHRMIRNLCLSIIDEQQMVI